MASTRGKNFKKRHKDKDEVYSKTVRAGHRTYFLDVKLSKTNEHYITLTESKKKCRSNGTYQYEKHKLFLYKEDFEDFLNKLTDIINYANKAESVKTEEKSAIETYSKGDETNQVSEYTDIDFEDLENVEIPTQNKYGE